MSKDWIAGAIEHKGALHEELGVAKGKKIPSGKLEKAAHARGKLGQRARLAETLKGLHHGYGVGDVQKETETMPSKPKVHGMQMGGDGFGMSHGMEAHDRPRVPGHGHDHSSHGVGAAYGDLYAAEDRAQALATAGKASKVTPSVHSGKFTVAQVGSAETSGSRGGKFHVSKHGKKVYAE